MNSTPEQPSEAPEVRKSGCARCGEPITYDPRDPGNYAMRVCNECAIDLDEELDQ
jgi:hypothetical protein